MDSNLSAVTETVPQISYDVIGRIIPGTAILLCLFLTIVGPVQEPKSVVEFLGWIGPLLNIWGAALVVVLAYVLAMVLEGLFCLIIWETFPGIHIYFTRRDEAGPIPDGSASESVKFERINQEWPKAGSWLTKLYAETSLCRLLATGWSICAAVNLGYIVVHTVTALRGAAINNCDATYWAVRLLWEIVLLAGIVGVLWTSQSITQARDRRMDNLWRILLTQDVDTHIAQTMSKAEGPDRE